MQFLIKIFFSIHNYTLNVPKRYEKCLSEVKISIFSSSRKWEDNTVDGWHRRGPNESRNKDSPSIKCKWPSRRTLDGQKSGQLLVLRIGNYPNQVGLRPEDVEGNGNIPHYYFPRKDLKIYIKEEEKWKPWWQNTSATFSSTIPDLLTCSIPINNQKQCRMFKFLLLNIYEYILNIEGLLKS